MDLPKEAFLYWIHCNRCFEIFVHKTCEMYILSCQHISCAKCATKEEGENDIYNCPICENKVRGRLIGNNLPPHLKELFHPQPWLQGLPVANIVRFQQPHREHFQMGMQRLSVRAERLKEQTSQMRAHVRKKFEELEKLRFERKELEKQVRDVIKQRKERDQERAQREAELQNHASSSTSSSDLDFSCDTTMQRYPIRSQRATFSRRPRSELGVNNSRLQNQDNLSFRNFTSPNTADFTL